MGWTSYHATHYDKHGKIDRKAECDAYWLEGLNTGNYRVEKSAMVGSVYYAAVTGLKRYDRENKVYVDVPAEEQSTFGVVFLTSTNVKDYYNFMYKDMDETCGPGCIDCPKSILKMLSPTDNAFALDWRRRCYERLEKKKNDKFSLSKLPIGTVIEFECRGKMVQYEKTSPAYQFKTPFWFNGTSYFPKKYIPENYRVVTMGG